jgi:hypothetical protein
MKSEKERVETDVALPHKALIDQLIDCGLACENCIAQCLRERDVNMMVRCMELDRDCADLCFQTARLLVRDSEIIERWVKACSEVCSLCAQECRKHEMDHCQLCANACEQCAKACHEHESKLQAV